MVKWRVTNGAPQSSDDLLEIPKGAIRIDIPEDIVALRAKSIDEAMAERLRVRTEFLTAFDNGYRVMVFQMLMVIFFPMLRVGNSEDTRVRTSQNLLASSQAV